MLRIRTQSREWSNPTAAGWAGFDTISEEMAKPLQGPRTYTALRKALLAWYTTNRRDLPWRRHPDPYRTWVSEIMLQQTRVAAVLEHFRLFLEAFPDITALASAPEEKVLALWSGLGYYRRARMLHKAAQVVVSELHGRIPDTSEELRGLPGVGRYTAAAIASIAYGEAVAVVDGNVERVLSRLDGQPRDDQSAWLRAEELLYHGRPGDWNQAMMELGALVCTPTAPQCGLCPVRRWCVAPGADVGREQPERKRVRQWLALVESGETVLLSQRAAQASKMAGMWELPELSEAVAEKIASQEKPLALLRHSITDTNYEVRVVGAAARDLPVELRRGGRWVPRAELSGLALTGLARKVLRKLGRMA
jgi:A/G-specific adenine glycosylase